MSARQASPEISQYIFAWLHEPVNTYVLGIINKQHSVSYPYQVGNMVSEKYSNFRGPMEIRSDISYNVIFKWFILRNSTPKLG